MTAGAWEERLRDVPMICLELHRRAKPGEPITHEMCNMVPDYAAMAALVEEALGEQAKEIELLNAVLAEYHEFDDGAHRANCRLCAALAEGT